MSLQSKSPQLPAQLWLRLRDGVLRSVLVVEIEWIKAASNFVAIRVQGGEDLITRATIESVEKRLGPRFVRIHRGFLVNRELLKEIRIEGGKVTAVLYTGSLLPVSRHYRTQLVENLAGSEGLFSPRRSSNNNEK